MHQHVITFHRNGTASTLHTETLPLRKLIGPYTLRRASHIWPAAFWKRCGFRLLRRFLGDKGKAAAWSRTWRGPWTAHLIDLKRSMTFPTRKGALRWEHYHLNK